MLKALQFIPTFLDLTSPILAVIFSTLVFLLNLPTSVSKGRYTYTLIISRDYIRPQAMFNFLRIKTKLQLQLEEYIKFKALSSPFIAEDHKEILSAFITHVSHTTVAEITPEEIQNYHNQISGEMTNFTVIKHMQAIRAFIRFNSRDTLIKADKVTNQGIEDLQDVGKKLPIVPEYRPKLGRPMNIALVKKVKRLRDNENLSFRAISKALGKDVKNIYLMYNYDISSRNVGK